MPTQPNGYSNVVFGIIKHPLYAVLVQYTLGSRTYCMGNHINNQVYFDFSTWYYADHTQIISDIWMNICANGNKT